MSNVPTSSTGMGCAPRDPAGTNDGNRVSRSIGLISADQRHCFVIAEAGVNHNGSLDMAKDLIDVAAGAGADAVKFQSFSTARLVTDGAEKARYQVENVGRGSQADMLRALELGPRETRNLKQHCDWRGIEFMSTPFDPDIMRFLVSDLGMRRVKVPSGEAINGPLLLAAARSARPVLLSTGMCTIDEVLESLSVLAWGMMHPDGMPSGRQELSDLRTSEDWIAPLKGRVWLMHCVSQYPAPADLTNLRAMEYLSDRTGLPAGLSDHSVGRHIALAAVARGACVLEKHFTLSRSLAGPDHKASLEPDELTAMIREIRDIQTAIGCYEKRPQDVEFLNAAAARGSLVAMARIGAGAGFTPENLTIKRPGNGISPLEFWDYVSGKTAKRDYEPDDLID